ncbi:MAG: AAA family ATPase [Stenomitos rutilans HA7619-LM2]|jgi:energy-coupling factor transporter ATP-binding protein EcfA2|nr:AAA family ATPase [Stenomitos rutilans HA7619-LM2]
MYIHLIVIRNIRSIENLFWRITPPQAAGWHVIIGDNGSGKSTFLRCISLALIGPIEAAALRQNWNDWLSQKKTSGSIQLGLLFDRTKDKFSGKGRTIESNTLPVKISFSKADTEVKIKSVKIERVDPERFIWSGKSGWFSASYGPFRRFTGGDKEYDRLFYSNPRLASHLSIFGEDVALTEAIRWLQDLQFKKLEKNPEGNLLDSVKEFVNQSEFLPHKVRLESVSSAGVEFIDGDGYKLPVEDLSDGYRSILSMTFELIRQLAQVYGAKNIFDPGDKTKVIVPGVVLIDEIDAHLHPTWQRRIGIWFRTHFPKIQFIVSTHSPLICQAATVGTVWRLPKPGSNESGGMVTGQELDRLLYGNVLDAYGTEAFGANVTRSEESKQLLRRLAELNQKELYEQLSDTEQEEQTNLRAMMPTAASAVN